ncbi:MAG: O-antigen ligase family protein, partial [bacterium]
MAGFLLVSVFISSLLSVHPNDSFWGSFLRQQGFYNFFNYLLFFALIILNLKDFKQVKKIIIAVIASASLTVVYGFVQYFNLDPIRWTENGLSTDRIFSALGQPNFFGHYLILVIPFSLYCLIFMAKSFFSRFFIGLALLAQLVCLVFTYSRAAWLGFLGSMIFLLIFWLLYKRFKKIAYAFMGLLLVGLGLIVFLNLTDNSAVNAPAPLGIVNRIKSMADFKSGSGKMRFYYIKYALEEIKRESPLRLLAGSGPETLTGLYLKYYQIDWGIYETINTVPDRAHNWLFDQILALGILGLLATLLFYIFIIYKAIRFVLGRPKLESDDWLLIFLFASLTAYCINNFFSFSLFTVLVYLYLILALAWFIINYQQEEKIINIRLTVFSKLLIWLALLACSAVFIYTNNINQARAEIYYIKAIKSFRASDFQGVINNFNKTIQLSPGSSYYQEDYLFLLLNCLPAIKNKADMAKLYNNLLLHIEEI